MEILKYIKLLALLKNVQTVYCEDTGKDRPFYLSRRFIGSALAVVGGVLTLLFGLKLDQSMLDQLTENIPMAISSVLTIYGIVMHIVGQVKATIPVVPPSK